MARLFTSGFELQSATTGVEFTTGGLNGTSGIDTTHQRSGAACMKYDVTSSFSWMKQVVKAAVDNNEIFVRLYVNFSTLPTGTATKSEVLVIANTVGVTLQAELVYDPTTQKIQALDSGGTVIGSSAVITTGTWYRLELDVKGAAGAAGTVKAYLDGTNFASSTTATVGTFDGMYFGIAFSAGTYLAYFDDIAVNDTSGSSQTGLPGSAKVIALFPNAAGDANSFATQTGGTAGAANNFTRVKEKPPDDATTFNGSSTLNEEDLFNVDASGIGASDTVNLVAVVGRHRNSTADATERLTYEILKTTGGTKGTSTALQINSTVWRTNNNITTLLPVITKYVDPDGGAWTQTTLDSMQIGYKLTTAPGTAGRRADVTIVVAMVDYTPVTGTTYAQTITDALVLVDTVIKATTRPLTNAIVMVDTVTKSTSRTLSDVITMAANAVKSASRTLSDAVVMVDSIVKSTVRTLSDVITLSDTFSRVWTLSRTYSEVITMVDSITRSISRILTDAIVLADTIKKSITRTLTDAIVMVDTAIKATLRTLSEAVTMVDSVIKATFRTLVDTLTLVDVLTGSRLLARILTETITMADSIVKSISRTFAEAIVLSDSIVKSLQRTIVQALVLVDTVSKSIARTLSDAVTLVDSVLKSISRTISDVVTLAANATKQIGKQLTETVTLSDVFSRLLTKGITLIETLVLNDSIYKSIAKFFTETLSLGDILTAAKDTARNFGHFILHSIYRAAHELEDLAKSFTLYDTSKNKTLNDKPKSATLYDKGRTNTLKAE